MAWPRARPGGAECLLAPGRSSRGGGGQALCHARNGPQRQERLRKEASAPSSGPGPPPRPRCSLCRDSCGRGGGGAGLAPHHPVLELPEVSGAQRAEARWRAAHWAVPLAGRAGSGGLSIWKQSCSYVSWPGRARLRVRELHSEGHGLRGESSQQPKNPDSCPGLRPALGLLGSPAQPGAGSAAAAASRNSVHFSSPRGGDGDPTPGAMGVPVVETPLRTVTSGKVKHEGGAG